ncbi:MAG: carboxylesterase family protein [Acidobacteriota bacterium]|nr:carboxylesterase family protein [Acidobacteriota bacterium]
MQTIRIAIAALAALPLLAGIQEPIKTEGGLITGTPGWGWGVREYLGIPFAAPPVGELRWKAPQPVVPWQGVRAADRFSPACMQRQYSANSSSWNRGLIVTGEDCLYLNVWTPAASASEKLPVMVWIYGGGGVNGSAAEPIYDGNETAKKGVVVVSMNYRVGVFGWMAHPELTKESAHRASGNYGSLDQLAAIKWVKNNIAAFGGDPGKVTIWGESGGSRSVNFLAASPLLKGLARAAIAESHTSFGRMTTLAEAEANGMTFMKAAGKTSLAGLRALSSEEVLDAYGKSGVTMNAAIVDGWFLPDDIYTIYSHGRQNDLALLTGGTNDEGGNLVAIGAPGTASGGGRGRGAGTPDTLAKYTAWARSTFGAKADTLLKLYPASDDAGAAKAYHDVYRDINYAGHRTWAKLQATTGKAPAYLYVFSQIPPRPAGNGNNPPAGRGATHFSEVIYVFNNLRMKDYPWTATDRKVADTLSTYWTNFAKNMNPNGSGLVNWPAYDPKDERWLNIGGSVSPEKFNSAGIDFIASVQEELRRAH